MIEYNTHLRIFKNVFPFADNFYMHLELRYMLIFFSGNCNACKGFKYVIKSQAHMSKVVVNKFPHILN